MACKYIIQGFLKGEFEFRDGHPRHLRFHAIEKRLIVGL
jgi:hypothetical protein